jgi:putative hydrolase of the HAD superfamily
VQKYLVWDFDGTLGYREGGWTGAMAEVLCRYAPEVEATADHVRPHIQTGFPWHDPHQPYSIRSAEQWWNDLSLIFEKAFIAVGAETSRAKHMAQEVRFAYAAPENWRLYDDTIPLLTQLSEAGWTHLLLSNHVPSCPEY